MAYGLLGAGQAYRQQALQGMQNLANQEQARNSFNKQVKQQERAGTIQMATTGGLAGAMYGAKLGGLTGPQGALAGALAGLVLGELF